jgi:hypothetical protein
MTARFRRVAVFVGTAALATGAGIGVAAQGDPTTTAPSVNGQQDPGARGPDRSLDVSALAQALGVSKTRLTEAMQNTREAQPGPGGLDERIQALADELGLPVDTVRAAFDSAFGQRGGPPPAAGQDTPPATGQDTSRS